MSHSKILGLDLGTNSIGWALIEETNDTPTKIIDGGVRIFIKSVEDKTPTPKNQARRNARLARRVIQRRARRKQRVLNFLISKKLLPQDLSNNKSPETILNRIGDPYDLRKDALYKSLKPYELGRVILHMASKAWFSE